MELDAYSHSDKDLISYMNNIKYLIVLCALSACFLHISCYVPEMLIDSTEYRRYRNMSSSLDIPSNFYTIITKRGIIIRAKDDFVYFRRSSYMLNNNSLNVLDNIRNFINEEENRNIKIVVEGHSDSSGGYGALFDNVVLSKKRSEETINKLIEMGIDKSRLISRYYSDYLPYYVDSPYDTNRSERNRRVEFVFIGGEKDWDNYQNSTEDVLAKVVEIENMIKDYNNKYNRKIE